jgi:RNA polymerase sigma factor (sigma-70 family)
MHYFDEDPSQFESFRQGKREGFKHFFDKYSGLIQEFIQRRIRDKQVARGLALDDFAELYEQRETIKDEEHLRRFLYSTAKNYCRDYFREKRRFFELYSHLHYAGSVEDGLATVEADLTRGETLLALRTSWQKLPFRKRRVVVLYYFHGLTSHAIAARLRISRQTVLNHLSQSIILLRKDLNGRWEENNLSFS